MIFLLVVSFTRVSNAGDFETAKKAMDAGADIHAMEDYSLRNSAKNGHLEVVKYLVEKGANIYAKDEEVILRVRAEKYTDEILKFLKNVKKNPKYQLEANFNKKLSSMTVNKIYIDASKLE